jgi:acyl-coenzyme A synthetase/AMP-(fatty) acid ligase
MAPERFNFTRDVVEQADPTKLALRFVDRAGSIRDLTFGDAAQGAARWAALLRRRGVASGDRVLVLVGKTPDWHAVMLGALKAGAVSIPCSEMLRAKDLDFRVRHSGARLLVADPACRAEVEAMGETPDVVFIDEAELDEPEADTADTAARDPALILYTSGTTKDPKGVVHTHGYTWAKREQAERWLDARPGDLVWCTAGTGWAKSIWNVLLGPWSCGAAIVLHEGGFDPEERFRLIEELQISVLCQAPTEYRLMAKLEGIDRYDLSPVRHMVSAGEPLNPEVIRAFESAFGKTIHDGYGQTENTLLVGNFPGAEIRPGSMGLPAPGYDVQVIDFDGRVAPAGEEGDIALRGEAPALFAGYWNAPDETAAIYREEWYVTGDRAVRDEDGYFWFTGRADDVILSAAYRIGPFEVESALLEHAAVAESAVVGKPDPDRGQIVKAFVVLRPGNQGGDALAAELQKHCKRVTAPYKYPREIEFVEELPKTRSGKIRRVELRKLEEDRADGERRP